MFRKTLRSRGKSPEQIRKGHKEKKQHLDLRDGVDQEKEVDEKAEIMRAREIVLEQDRLVAVLKDKFTHLSDIGNFTAYCDSLSIQETARDDLMRVFHRILFLLEGDSSAIFPDDIIQEEQQSLDELYTVVAERTKEYLSTEAQGELLSALVSGEVDLAIQVMTESRRRPVLAHRVRGFGKDEASKEGLRNAVEENIAELEFDIRFSKDGKSIIHHNATFGESSERVGAVREFTSQEIAAMELKGGEHVATLEEFFQMLGEVENTATKVNIDIKDFDTDALDEMLDLIHDYDMEHRVVIVSWLPQSLQYLYERDPSLSYSMSYFPAIRGISRWVLEQLEQYESGALLMGSVASKVAKSRANQVQGILAENITSAQVLDANEHWTTTKQRVASQGRDLIGKHPVAHSEPPVAGPDGEMSVMARVLQHGSVNIMLMEEQLTGVIDKLATLPGIGEWIDAHREGILNFLGRTNALQEFAQQLQQNDVKVHVFDVKNQDVVDHYVNNMRKAGVEPGVVYYSGKYEGLHTRGQTPDLAA